MLKINYPDTISDILSDYIEIFDFDISTKQSFNKFLSKRKFASLGIKSLDSILITPFDGLATILAKIPGLADKEKAYLEFILDYDKYQSRIADFFMRHKEGLKLYTCFYCNIDYVNIFDDIGDYQSGMDLIKRGSELELQKIQDIGEKTAKRVKSNAHAISSLDTCRLTPNQKKNIHQLTVKRAHNHFTLDHVIDKGKNPLFALSFYNFVPSCYSCNSKFKKSKQLITKDMPHEFISPTSENFSFDSDVKFKIFFYDDGEKNPDKKIIEIKGVNDFTLDFEYKRERKVYENYINIFKLKGRYKIHKNIVVDLIEKSQKFPETKLNEMSKLLGITSLEIKKDIFGRETISNQMSEMVPLSKLKRDIASNIGII